MKYLTLITLVLMATSAQADFWDNCTAYGGTIITANSYGNDKGGLCNDPSNPDLTNNCNGKRFCMGGNTMNWWSAFTWCEAIGGKVPSLDSTCPATQPITGQSCPNLKAVLLYEVWISSGPSDSSRAFSVTTSGSLYRASTGTAKQRHISNTTKAICEE